MGASTGRQRILYVSGYADVTGGGQVSLLLLMRLLNRTRFLPLLLCPDEGEVARRARDLGVEVYSLGVRPYIDSRSAMLHALSLRKCAKTLGAAVVHCDTIYTALMSGIGLMGLRVPIIFHARSAESGGVFDAILPLLCAKIICVSNATGRRFSRQSPSTVHVIYNGVDLSEFRPGSPPRRLRQKLGIAEDAFVVGYAGQLTKGKGLDVLVHAFARLRTKLPDAMLLIMGRGHDGAALQAMAGDGVRFLPFSDFMPEFYAALDVFALPTRYAEGLPRSLIESMACAVPSVATPIGGNVEALVDGETGYFVPAQDEVALHDRLRQLYLAPAERNRMGTAARKKAERLFDAVTCARAVEELYLQVCP
ncbi:MAG TPA: glycosyltransferase family 4 protein [Candidatus Acidoferrum sp.]|nr:glycosyltransferase family 4 protein [Candidatus Acidoferrum sp.]